MSSALRVFWVSLGIAGTAAACGTSTPPEDAGARDGQATDATGPTDADVGDGQATDARDDGARPDAARPDADAGACTVAPVGRVCVRGTVGEGGATEELAVGAAVRFQLFPKGCFSSSCSVVREARCDVGAPTGSDVPVTGAFCIGSVGGAGGCTPDCSGGGFASCERALDAGAYTATLGGLTLVFTVPSSLPPGGRCVGSQF
ncbi:MAG TPA: hypothetical protein PLR99_07895 [Polyangiaceae bacterium]|nr:hypothetical protein [Polyangiaceae bacterium]